MEGSLDNELGKAPITLCDYTGKKTPSSLNSEPSPLSPHPPLATCCLFITSTSSGLALTTGWLTGDGRKQQSAVELFPLCLCRLLSEAARRLAALIAASDLDAVTTRLDNYTDSQRMKKIGRVLHQKRLTLQHSLSFFTCKRAKTLSKGL